MDKEGDGYLTSQDNRRILRHGAPMRLGANRQRGAQSASLEDGTLCLQFRGYRQRIAEWDSGQMEKEGMKCRTQE